MLIDPENTIAVITIKRRSIRILQAKKIQRSNSCLWEMSETW